MSETAPAHVIDLRDGESFLGAVLDVVQRHVGRPVGIDDADRDFEIELGVHPRQKLEIAGALAEHLDLPGEHDDALNSCVIETLALSRTPRDLAVNAGAVHPGGVDSHSRRLHAAAPVTEIIAALRTA